MKCKADAKVIFYVVYTVLSIKRVFHLILTKILKVLSSFYIKRTHSKKKKKGENTFRNLPKDTQIARAGAMLDTRIFDSKSSVPSTKLLLHKNISLGPPEDYFIKG